MADCKPSTAAYLAYACSPAPSQISSRYGSESNKAAVDLVVYDPEGKEIHREEGISETELAVSGEGGQVGGGECVWGGGWVAGGWVGDPDWV